MSDSTLLNQGKGLNKMKKLRKKEQQKSIIMKENNNDNISNTESKVTEGFVESMDKSYIKFENFTNPEDSSSISNVNNPLAALTKKETEKFNELRSDFDKTLTSYADVQKSLNELSLDFIKKGGNDKNIYAEEVELNDGDITHEGCYNDRWWRTLNHNVGYMSKEECADAAAQLGKPVFGLQNGNRRDRWYLKPGEDYKGKGYCFVGDSLDDAKRLGIGRYNRWSWALSWQSGFRNTGRGYRWSYQWVNTWWGRRRRWVRIYDNNPWYRYQQNYVRRGGIYLRLSDQGQVELSNKSKGGTVIWKSYNNVSSSTTEWETKMNFDYGGNDIRSYQNVSLDFCHKKCIEYDNCVVHNYWGKQRRCWLKHGFSKGGKWRDSEKMNSYIKRSKPIKSFLIIEDDGSCVLYKGTGPNDKQGVLFSFRTKYNSNNVEKNEKWLKYRKYGRNYITNDQYLYKGQYIASNNGKYVLYLWYDGNILIGANMTKCRDSSNGRVGGYYANSVYSIDKKDVSYIGKGFYQDEDGDQFAYQDKDITFGSNYTLLKEGYNTYYNDLGWEWVKTVEQAKSVCNSDHRCAGFVYEKYSEYPQVSHGWNRVWKKSKDMWPKPSSNRFHLRKNNFTDIYVREKKFRNHYSCNDEVDMKVTSEKLKELAGAGEARATYKTREQTIAWPVRYYNRKIRTPTEAEKACTDDYDCKGYIFNRENLSKGESYLYKSWFRGYNPRYSGHSNFDLYSKEQSILSGMDGIMNRNKKCSIYKATYQERDILQKKKADLMVKLKAIIDDMKSLLGKAEKLNNETDKGREQRIKDIYEYERIFKNMSQEEEDLQILNQQEIDEEMILTSENYKYISYTVAAILLMIMAFKYMKKQ